MLRYFGAHYFRADYFSQKLLASVFVSQTGDWALTRKEMARLLRQERRFRKEKRTVERRQLEEELSLSEAIERAYRRAIGLPEDDDTPIEVIAEAIETAPLIDLDQVLAVLRQSEDFERFLDLMETQRRASLQGPSRKRKKLKVLMLAA